MQLTADQLRIIAPSCKHPETWVEPLNITIQRFHIDTPTRAAAFLAQLAHESGEFKFTRELWGPTNAQRKYESRHDLGNNQPGDGHRFLGRGLIQITGRANYQAASDYFSIDFVTNPDLMEMPQYAALVSGWFWDKHNLNDIADLDTDIAFGQITRTINGGLNGLVSRQSYWRRAKRALKSGDSA